MTEEGAVAVRCERWVVGWDPRQMPTLEEMATLSPRLRAVVEALPLRSGMRVVEIGCGPGAAVRAVSELVGPAGHVLAVDRSPRAIEQVSRSASDLIAAGRVSVRHTPVEELVLLPGEAPYDLAFAVRVGAFDGRFPDAGVRALGRLARVLVPGGQLFIDGGDPLRRLDLPTVQP
ncbi:MAG TPA: methyltransferase domain-containing protein [Acidimicrobiales bacterium]|nr:methyltransferase domain-containing protein [Acidimicrobiales bacterium]